MIPRTHRYTSFDGIGLAWHEMGEGRAVLLLHGLFSNAQTNWIKFGHAARLAGAGFRVIMPDLRAHGESDAPHDGAAYPADVLATDGLALVGHLGLTDYDLCGYSLGARTVVRMIVRGETPRRAVLAGMGLEGLTDTATRAAHFRRILAGLGNHSRGSAEWMAQAFLKTTGGDPVALTLLLDSFVDTSEGDIRAIRQPALVLGGVDDHDNGSRDALVGLLPHASAQDIVGNHMSAVTGPALGEAVAAFLLDTQTLSRPDG